MSTNKLLKNQKTKNVKQIYIGIYAKAQILIVTAYKSTAAIAFPFVCRRHCQVLSMSFF